MRRGTYPPELLAAVREALDRWQQYDTGYKLDALGYVAQCLGVTRRRALSLVKAAERA